jgi:sugar (pentulose or hexulose) kinase
VSFLAIGIGSLTLKAAVLDVGTLSLRHVSGVPFPQPLPGQPRLFYEVDPKIVLNSVNKLMAGLMPLTPDCSGVVLCGQMGGLILVNDRGEPQSNYVSWQDQRLLTPLPSGAGTYFDEFRRRLSPERQMQLGREIFPGHAAALLFWLKHAGQRVSRRLYACSLPDFVVANLCRTPPAANATICVGTLDFQTGDWHRDVFAELGIEEFAWPALRDFREPVGTLQGGASAAPCYTAVGDHQCALAGAFLREGELSLNISTGSQVSLLTRKYLPGDYQTRPYFDGLFLNTITHIPAGRALNVLLRLLRELTEAQELDLRDPWPYITREASRVVDSDLRVDLAFFSGPVGERGCMSNISEANLTIGHVYHAAFRNMADNYSRCAARLAHSGVWNDLVLSGGLVRKIGVLRELIVEAFRCLYRIAPSTEDTLLGLMALALVIEGRAVNVAEAAEVLRRHESRFAVGGE